jgi:hypothetical protein
MVALPAMGIFDQPGEYDENSFWYLLKDRETKALDQAIKARRDIAALSDDLSRNAVSDVDRLRAQIAEQEHKLMALGLYTRTLLQLLLDKGLVTAEEFTGRHDQLDLLDGKQDGR